MQLASFIDHTVLKPATTLADVAKVCSEAAAYNFAAVCVPPVYVQQSMGFLKSSGVKVATVIGFPFGYTYTSAKLQEIKEAIKDGAQEVDVVHNLTALKNGDLDYLKKEMEAITTFLKPHATTLKVIIESSLLSDDEVIKCCQIYQNYKVDFLKTSTGYAEGGATVHAVQLMRAHLPPAIQIKASGGIRDYAFAQSLVAAGATRLGCSASVAILNGAPANDTTY